MIGTSDFLRVLLLEDYNTRLVVTGTSMLGAVSGMIGSFMLLRRRALLGDALSHATLPGIALAFIIATACGVDGRSLPVLLFGATCSGLIGVGFVVLIRSQTRLKDDAALGIALSVLFGIGIVLMSFVQELPEAGKAGLHSFIYGKTASIISRDVLVILIAAAGVGGICLLMGRAFTMLCFDATFMRTLGWPGWLLDLLLMTLVTVVVVVGLQAVGLILMIAMLIIPAAAASFWTRRLKPMIGIATVSGAISGWLGATLSALIQDLPAGAIIVLIAASVFAISMCFGSARGVLWRWLEQRRMARTISHQHLLRAMFELEESHETTNFQNLMAKRSWSSGHVRKALQRAIRQRFVRPVEEDHWTLTESGSKQASLLTRRHRLWELFLIRHADIAPTHVDRAADDIEHVLDADIVRALERELDGVHEMPTDPHRDDDQTWGDA